MKKKSPNRFSRFVKKWTPPALRGFIDHQTAPMVSDLALGGLNFLRHTPKVLTKDEVYERGLSILKRGTKSILVVNTVGKEGAQKYVLHWGHDYQKEYFEELFRIVQKNRHGVGGKLPIARYTNLNDRQKCEEAISLLMYGSDVEIYHSTIPIEFLIRDEEEVLLGFPVNNELTHGVQLSKARDVCATLRRWIEDQSGPIKRELHVEADPESESPLPEIDHGPAAVTVEDVYKDAQSIARRFRDKHEHPDIPNHSLIHALDLLESMDNKEPIAATKDAFDSFKDWYPALYDENEYEYRYKALAEYTKSLTRKLHPVFLDVGCANGVGAEILHDNGIRFWGVDVAGSLLKKARRESPHEMFIEDDMIHVLLQAGKDVRGKGEYSHLPDELDVIACQGNTFDFFLGDLQKWFALTLFKSRLAPGGILFVTQRSFQKGESEVKRSIPRAGDPDEVIYGLTWSGDFVKIDVRVKDKLGAEKCLGTVVQHPTAPNWLKETAQKAGLHPIDYSGSELPKWFGPRGGQPYEAFVFQLPK